MGCTRGDGTMRGARRVAEGKREEREGAEAVRRLGRDGSAAQVAALDWLEGKGRQAGLAQGKKREGKAGPAWKGKEKGRRRERKIRGENPEIFLKLRDNSKEGFNENDLTKPAKERNERLCLEEKAREGDSIPGSIARARVPTLMEGRATRRGARPRRRLAQEYGHERGKDLSGKEEMMTVGESR